MGAVGGTDFASRGVIGEETAWSASGGGFSDNFPIPDWQKMAVAAYKASPDADLPPSNLWNNTGRGYPDVAALGGQVNPYCVATGGSRLRSFGQGRHEECEECYQRDRLNCIDVLHSSCRYFV